jgi:hypothetical protein
VLAVSSFICLVFKELYVSTFVGHKKISYQIHKEKATVIIKQFDFHVLVKLLRSKAAKNNLPQPQKVCNYYNFPISNLSFTHDLVERPILPIPPL